MHLTIDAPPVSGHRGLEAPDGGKREEDFEALRQQTIAAARASDERLALLGHELRNPLNAIATSAEVLRRSAPGSREATRAADVIGRQVARLARLIDLRLPALGRSAEVAQGAKARLTTCRIGLIDDDPDALSGLQSMLELDGHQVRIAADGPGGLAMLIGPAGDAPDVAIVDIDLPGFSGHEVAERCRAGGYRGRLIALSGQVRDDDVQRSLIAGFEVHLKKPVDFDQLARLLLR